MQFSLQLVSQHWKKKLLQAAGYMLHIAMVSKHVEVSGRVLQLVLHSESFFVTCVAMASRDMLQEDCSV